MSNDKSREELLNFASKKLNMSQADIEKNAGKNGEKLLEKLSENDRQKISGVLSDPQKTKEILSSPKAQELLKKFFGEK